ncbi:chemotaxis protein CheD [Caulobacter sp. CCUG 60055]|uniref:chemotaxis protein CheD n=1 Tax=Caulobacter sp. CCUG 60055 TaxID=2100090 RepID=UPI00325A738D|nr:chemotaxis protein CheD [Caulobacteraceae bacterium]MCI3180044.1 chemotaxis protein CheD [Caulobacter sp. CCUG 60055]
MNLGPSQSFAAGRERTVHVGQGEFEVSDDPNVVMTTVLGSCVAACIRDPAAGLGGINHFLLPDREGGFEGEEARRYGVHAMEMLINRLLQAGARRDRLEAKLFGGACLFQRLKNIGADNAAFATRFLGAEGIPVRGGDLGGERARRIRYWPATGQAFQRLLDPSEDQIFIREQRSAVKAPVDQGDLELF